MVVDLCQCERSCIKFKFGGFATNVAFCEAKPHHEMLIFMNENIDLPKLIRNPCYFTLVSHSRVVRRANLMAVIGPPW